MPSTKKDRHLLEAEPNCLGAWLAIMPAGEEASALGDQAQNRVQDVVLVVVAFPHQEKVFADFPGRRWFR